MDFIKIQDLEVFCHHGVLKEENVLGQKFLVSLVLYTDVTGAGKNDDLSQSVDYAQVAHFVKEQMEQKRFQLIEAVAEHLARQILLAFPLVKKIEVTIKKPWAPILLPLDTVSVTITRQWTTVYLSIGSNIGDKRKYLENAIQALKERTTIRNVCVSDFIETEPYGYVDQDPFLNGAVQLETLENPQELLETLHEIEKQGNRTREIHWGPRTIDLYIVLYGDQIIQGQDLVIPHREMHLREFVLEPLAQIAPWAVHPIFHKTVAELLMEVKKNG